MCLPAVALTVDLVELSAIESPDWNTANPDGFLSMRSLIERSKGGQLTEP
jgi:hypothetical protein